ncbi:Gfo/Idh/MocA family protein [Candidatus Latescibacterota bacterium]
MELKVNIIGVGIMGKGVGRALQRNPNVKITACADLKQENLDAFMEELNFENSYTDYEKMLDAEKPDAVYIATPDWAHHDPVIACLEAGVHTHVEKPLTTDEREATNIVRKVRETGLKLQVSYNHRWLAPYNATYNMIREGQIGDCIMGYARKNNPIQVPTKMLPWSKNSSPMWFLSGHDIDLMTWWFDDDPVEAKGYGIKRVLKEKMGWDTYDAMQGLVKFSRGGFATFESTWIYPDTHPAMPDSFMEVVGEHGHIHLDRKTEAIEMSTPDGFKWPRSLLNYKVFDRWVGAFPSCINNFIDDILEDRKPVVSAYDGWRSTAVLDAIHRSADTGETVKISEPPV